MSDGAKTGIGARLAELGIELPPARPPLGNFVPVVREGTLLYLSGQGPVEANGTRHVGKVGGDIGPEQAYQHARLTAINLLGVLARELGSLDRVRRIIKLLGMVNAVPEFTAHPQVINGASDLMVELFGPEIGRHARSAVGMGSLPGGITVEIEMIVAIQD
jgi:enamine deaminase RidA (YjgF/YER057c/UK114 family)